MLLLGYSFKVPGRFRDISGCPRASSAVLAITARYGQLGLVNGSTTRPSLV
jgi:hypothetical protein